MSQSEAARRLRLSVGTLKKYFRLFGGVDRSGRPLYRREGDAWNAPWWISETQLREIWGMLPSSARRPLRGPDPHERDLTVEEFLARAGELLGRSGR